MAGDWIKLEHSTPEKPEIYRLARMLGVSRGDAFLLSVEWWMWLDRNSRNGDVTLMLRQDVDTMMHAAGFAAAMEAVGWLQFDDVTGRIVVPNFDRHNGKTAKDRALTKDRVANFRAENGNDDVTEKSLPEKRREEKRRSKAKTKTSAPTSSDAPPPDGVHAQNWNAWLKQKGKKQTAEADRLQRKHLAEWAAHGHDVNRIVEDAVAGGWAGLHAPDRRARNSGPPTLAERRSSSIDSVIAKGNGNGRVISGVAERVDRPVVRAVPSDLREPCRHDVRVDGDGPGGKEKANG